MSARDGQSQPGGPESLGGIGYAKASAGSGHTPGPWAVDRKASTRVHAANDRGIATAGGYQTNAIDPDVLLAENEANARLISAAPDLLEAAEAMMEVLTRTVSTYNGDTSYDDTGVFDNETALLRTAIAKATR